MIRTINIGGKDRPVYYGINALADFNEATNTTLIWIFKMVENPVTMNFNQLRYLVYVGLTEGAKESNIPVDFTVEEVGRWLNADFGKFKEFMAACIETIPKGDDTKKNMRADREKK